MLSASAQQLLLRQITKLRFSLPILITQVIKFWKVQYKKKKENSIYNT